VNDFASGAAAAQMLLAACANGPVTCDEGRIVRFPVGYSAGDDRIMGFESVVEGKLRTITIADSGGFQETEGYSVAAQVVPPIRQRISWVYGNNDALAIGALQALTENGLEPNKDVMVVGGTCHGDSTHLVNGDLVGTAIQPAFLEGWLSVQTLHKFLKTGTVIPGELQLAADPVTPPSDEGAPHQFNFMLNPVIEPNQASYDESTIWGYSMQKLCDY